MMSCPSMLQWEHDQLVAAAAALHQQVSTSRIRQTRTVFDASVPRQRATWGKFSPSKEIDDLLKRSAVLQSQTH